MIEDITRFYGTLCFFSFFPLLQTTYKFFPNYRDHMFLVTLDICNRLNFLYLTPKCFLLCVYT